MASLQENDLHIDGLLTAKSMVTPADSVTSASVDAASPLAVNKTVHQKTLTYSQEGATVVADGEWPVHVVDGTTATVVKFKIGCVVAPIGAATVAIDLLNDRSHRVKYGKLGPEHWMMFPDL